MACRHTERVRVEVLKLEEMFEMRQGLTFGRPQHQSLTDSARTYRFLQLTNLRDKKVDTTGMFKEEKLKASVAAPHVPRAGAIILSLRAPGLPLAVVDEALPGYVVSHNLAMMTLRPEHLDGVRPEFVALMLQTWEMQRRLRPLYSGVNPPHLPLRLLRSVTIGIPPIKIQDALVDARQALEWDESVAQRFHEDRRGEWELHTVAFALVDEVSSSTKSNSGEQS